MMYSSGHILTKQQLIYSFFMIYRLKNGTIYPLGTGYFEMLRLDALKPEMNRNSCRSSPEHFRYRTLPCCTSIRKNHSFTENCINN